ncbi:MAG: 30S ribosomal protein S16 [Candidatus Berkelbacteria bacterium]|nr:30S ribosomal protein S16 [Candidatus Berkelbacteria bacterium]
MLKIRLSRVGKSHTPIYRLVVAEKSRAVKRENIEILGLYNPANKEDRFQVKKDRVLYWIGMGAQPSDTARNLLCDFDVLPKKDKIKVVHGKATKKKAAKVETTQIIDTEKTQNKSEEIVPEEAAEVPAEVTDETAVSEIAETEPAVEELPTKETVINNNEETAPTVSTEEPQK